MRVYAKQFLTHCLSLFHIASSCSIHIAQEQQGGNLWKLYFVYLLHHVKPYLLMVNDCV